MPEPKPASAPAHAPPMGAGVAIVTIILTLAAWTTIPLFLRSFIKHVDGWTANGWRYGISALIWLPPLVWAMRRGEAGRDLWKRALWPSVFNIVAQVCFGLAPYYIPPGLMTFSLRLQIVFVAIAAAILFLPERRVIRQGTFLLGLGVVLAGTSGTLLLDEQTKLWSTIKGLLGLGVGEAPSIVGDGEAMKAVAGATHERVIGVALAIGAGLLYAGYALSVRWWLQGRNPFIAFSVVSQYTALGLVALMLVFARDPATHAADYGAHAMNLSPRIFARLVLSSIIGIGIGHTLYYFSISRLGLAVSAGVVQLQPVTVSIASMFLFGEVLSAGQWACGLCAIAGAGLILWTQQRMGHRRGLPGGGSARASSRQLPDHRGNGA